MNGVTNMRLGDIASFINGYPFKPNEWSNDGLPIIRIQNLNNPDAKYNLYDGKIDDRYHIKKGDVLISWSGSLGVYEWRKDDEALLNQHIFKVVFDKETINKGYFKYAVSSRISEMKGKVHGITMQHITKGDFDKTIIPVPSIIEQERIVAELDLLSGIIDKQKAQLKELDNLALSIFYDMFGDPVKNEKGWDVKKLGTVLKTTSGGTPSKGHPEYYENGKIPWVNSGDLHQTFIYNTPKHITQAGVDHSSAKLFPIDTCLIAMYGATVGEVSILKIQSTTNQAVCGIFPSKDYLSIFLYSALKYSKDHFVSLASGGAQPNISQGIIKDFDLITPSISLQQSFAEKMEILESQKISINNSIAESNKLFDYTMAKYFG